MEERGLVVVAGGAGYLGSVLVPLLLESGYRVRVLDSLIYGIRGLDVVREHVEIIEEDIRTVASTAVRGADALINLAAISNDPTANFRPQLCWDVNMTGAVHLAEMCMAEGVPRYVFASTCSVYDTRDASTTPPLCTEEQAVRPEGPYSSSKLEAERKLLALASSGFCTTSLRKGTLYGFSPRMRFDLVVNTFVRDALRCGSLTLHNGGSAWRPLLDVRDAAAAYKLSLEAPSADVNGKVFNILHRNERVVDIANSLRAVLARYEIAVETQSGPAPGAVRSYCADDARARGVLGFQSTVSVEQSIDDMLPRLKEFGYTDFENPWYSNIQWMEARAL